MRRRARGGVAATLSLGMAAVLAAAPVASPQVASPQSKQQTPRREEPQRSDPAPSSYVEARDSGAFADWLGGQVGVTGRSRIFRDIARSEAYYEQTRFAAELDGRKKVLDLIKEMPRDAGSRVGQDAPVFAVIEERVMARRSPRPPILRDSGRVFEVEMRFPLWGEMSVLSAVLDAMQPPQPPQPPPGTTSASSGGPEPPAPAPADATGVTGLVVDARRIERPAAALLPRILDEKGRLVYGLEVADPQRVRQTGLVAYSTPDPRTPDKLPGNRPGANPIRVEARSVVGATRADLAVSVGDAERILKAAASSGFLKECRVMILMPPAPRITPKVVQRPASVPPDRKTPRDPKEP